MRVKHGRVVLLDYVVRIATGKVVETSAGKAPIEYLHGAGQILPALERALDDELPPRGATVEVYLRLLATIPDTLVARKRGRGTAERVSAGAARVLAAGGVRTDAGRAAMAAFDASLRRDGNALNPGTTADLVTAVLFVALLEGLL
jgi:triphosphoribosyl-dephospho-CoA synthase